jgi:mono/diheme cytochrome c family protein
MGRKTFWHLSQLSALGVSLVGLLVGAPLWGDGGDPKKGENWYREAGCDSCHGKTGRGDGPSGAILNPKPADYCTSTKHPTDADKIKMITDGGASMGHSMAMPAWGGVLDKQAILDLVAYIHTLCKK